MPFEYVCWIDLRVCSVAGFGGVNLIRPSTYSSLLPFFFTSFRLGWEIKQSQLRVEGRLLKLSLVASQYGKNVFCLDQLKQRSVVTWSISSRAVEKFERRWTFSNICDSALSSFTRLEVVWNDDSRQPTTPCYLELFWLVPTPRITRKETGWLVKVSGNLMFGDVRFKGSAPDFVVSHPWRPSHKNRLADPCGRVD